MVVAIARERFPRPGKPARDGADLGDRRERRGCRDGRPSARKCV